MVLATGAISEDVEANVGVMLPLFDILNHKNPHQISWSGNAEYVTFALGEGAEGVAAGEEVYNNYGAKVKNI